MDEIAPLTSTVFATQPTRPRAIRSQGSVSRSEQHTGDSGTSESNVLSDEYEEEVTWQSFVTDFGRRRHGGGDVTFDDVDEECADELCKAVSDSANDVCKSRAGASGICVTTRQQDSATDETVSERTEPAILAQGVNLPWEMFAAWAVGDVWINIFLTY